MPQAPGAERKAGTGPASGPPEGARPTDALVLDMNPPEL